MVAKFVGENVGLGELARRSKSSLQLVKETEIDIHLLVGGTIKRPGRRLGCATAGRSHVSKQHQLGMTIWNSSLLKNSCPGLLRVIEHKRDELDQRLFACIALSVRLTDRLTRRDALVAEQGE